MWVWSSWKLVLESRTLRGTLPSRPHPGSGCDSVHPDTTRRSDWSGHTCGTTSLLFGNERSYLVTQQKNRLVNRKSLNTYREPTNSSRGRADLYSRPCLDPEWWRPCCCATRVSPLRCHGIVPTAVGTSRSPVPGGSCHTQQTPAGPASPPEPPVAYIGPV